MENEKSSLQKILDFMDAELKNRKPQEYDFGYMTPTAKKQFEEALKKLIPPNQIENQ